MPAPVGPRGAAAPRTLGALQHPDIAHAQGDYICTVILMLIVHTGLHASGRCYTSLGMQPLRQTPTFLEHAPLHCKHTSLPAR